MQTKNLGQLPATERSKLLGQLYVLRGLPDRAVQTWMETNSICPALHAKLGAVMALAPDSLVPRWAQHRGTPWPASGHRLIAPLCDVAGKMQSFVAQSITGGGSAVPSGFSIDGLIVACPTARRALAGEIKPTVILVTDTFTSWLQWAGRAQHRPGIVAVWGMLQGSWSEPLLRSIPSKCSVTLMREPEKPESERLSLARRALSARVANGNIELKQGIPQFRSAV